MANRVMGIVALLGLVVVGVGLMLDSKEGVVVGALTVFVALTWFGLSF